MKKLKKLVGLVLAMVMVFALCVPSFAADAQYTITVQKSAEGKTYNAYKIFDATYTEVGGGTYVSYTISEDDAWYSLVQSVNNGGSDGYSYDVTDEQGDVVSTVTVTSPFLLTETGEGTGVYTVTVKDGVTDQTIIDFFTNYNLNYGMPGSAVASGEGNGGDLVLNVKASGYYFVTTSTGSLVSITTADPTATVVDKSTTPGNLKKELLEGEDLENHWDHDGENVHTDTEAIGDDVEFVVTADVPLYDGAYLITDYEFEDTMSTGLYIELGADDVVAGTGNTAGNETGKYYLSTTMIDKWVTIGSASDSGVSLKLSELVGDYYLELEGVNAVYDEDGENVIGYTATGFVLYYETWNREQYEEDIDAGKIITSAADIDTGAYPTDATIKIDYAVHVNEKAEFDNTNVIEMVWHQTPFNSPSPKSPEYGGSKQDKDDIYVLMLEVDKIDAATEEPLSGAEFQLKGTGLHDVVVSTSIAYTPIESLEDYNDAVAKGTILYFALNDGSFTTVNPYDLAEGDSALSDYVVTANAEEGYPYAAYTREITSETQLVESGEEHIVTGTTDSAGKVVFSGLTYGDYVLTEIVAPNGYNLLGEDIEIYIRWDEESGEFTWAYDTDAFDEETAFEVPEDGTIVITVEDQAGMELPGTGGIGTTIFYVIGILLILIAAVVLITRRRMNKA